MDSVAKFLSKLSKKELSLILVLLEKIKIGEIESLDLKKLKWKKNLYRIRKWKIRIVFEKSDGLNVIFNIDYRGGVYQK